MTKTCAKCETAKPVGEFGFDRSRVDGRFPWCKPCKRGSDGTSHARHRPARNASARARYRQDPAPQRARSAQWYAANRDRKLATVLAWQSANPERAREIKRASWRRAWITDPERFREAWRRREAAIRQGREVFDFSPAQLADKIRYWGGRCWMCGAQASCVDHVKPLVAGGAHMLANLRPACTPCNARKAGRWPLRNHSRSGLLEP
jgi:5-methylcytosine-specific restriction endonuclease McrA